MKRFPGLFLLGLLAAGSLQAASIEGHLQDARAALTAGDYQAALQRLDEAERALGFASPAILLLRIKAQQVLLEAGRYRYLDLRAQRGNCAIYMHEFGINHPADAISPEISRLCATLTQYPREALEVVRANLQAGRFQTALEDLAALERFGGAWSEAQALLKIRALGQWRQAAPGEEAEQQMRHAARDYLDRVAAGQGQPSAAALAYVRALAGER